MFMKGPALRSRDTSRLSNPAVGMVPPAPDKEATAVSAG